VSQLQADLERFKTQHPNEGRDEVWVPLSCAPDIFSLPPVPYFQDERAKRERDRAKWNTLMEEIAKLKIQVSLLQPYADNHLNPLTQTERRT